MRILSITTGLAVSGLAAAGGQCSVPACPEGETCFATAARGMDCLFSIPFNEVGSNTTATGI